MGCSATKNLTVETLEGSKVTTLSANQDDPPRKNSIPRRASDVPPVDSTEPQTEMLDDENFNNVHQTPNGLSFEIPVVTDNNEASIIKKHPPKRFQKLEDQQTNPTLSLVQLQEKLDEAEIRRQQILQQRIQSAKQRYALRKQTSVVSTDEDLIHLKVPNEVPAVPNLYDVSYI